MISLKLGVRVQGLRPEILLAIMVAEGIWLKHDIELVITSGIEGKHTRGSEHYSGAAVDIRMNNVPQILRESVVHLVANSLGDDYDVLWEGAGTLGEHLHIEYDPKKEF